VMMSHFGCTELQGYFFSKPISAVQLTTLVNEFEPRSIAPMDGPVQDKVPRSATA
jgi:predicted signal transduction protein with EAL and GGDEF domain